MKYSIIRHIYSIVFFILLPFFLFQKFLIRKNRKFWIRLTERLGLIPFRLDDSVWIHSVSIGESIAISSLVKKLSVIYPDKDFVVTTATDTGSKQVKKLYQGIDNIYHSFVPFDIPIFLDIFMKRISVSVCIIMETEIWPNIVHKCHTNSIPVILSPK